MESPPPAERPVLVAVDFAPCSEAALAWAATEARAHGWPLVVLHVVHEPDDDPGYYRRIGIDDPSSSGLPLDVAARRAFEALLDRCRREMRDLRALGDVDVVLVSGLPATRILEVAADRDARLVVLGSRGRTGLRHLIGGSTAARVVQLSPVPVTVVKAARPAAADEEDAPS